MKVISVLQSIGNYFTTTNAPAASLMVKVGLVASLVLLVVSWVIPWFGALLKKKYKTIRWQEMMRLVQLFRYASLVWLVLFFLRYEGIFPFQVRIWNYGVLLIVLVIGYTLLRGMQRAKPVYERHNVLEDKYRKYLPQPHRK